MEVKPKAGHYKRVLVAEFEKGPATAVELAARLGWDLFQTRYRIYNLRVAGLLVPDVPRKGRNVFQRWRIVE